MLDSIRQVAPQIAIKGSKDQVQTGRFREKIRRRKKDLFGNEIDMIREALKSEKDFEYIRTIFELHLTLGAREGSTDPDSGLVGLTWDRFKKNFSKVDLYESKVRGGIWWRDCPLDLLFKSLPRRLKLLWTRRGKPTNEKVLRDGYKELLDIYNTIRSVLRVYYQDEGSFALEGIHNPSATRRRQNSRKSSMGSGGSRSKLSRDNSSVKMKASDSWDAVG